MSPEQRVAEKLRLKKLQEEADTKTALDTLGLASTMASNMASTSSIESFDPTTKEEFDEFATAITKIITQFRAKEEYVPFLDELVSKLCAGCEFNESNETCNMKFQRASLFLSFSVIDKH